MQLKQEKKDCPNIGITLLLDSKDHYFTISIVGKANDVKQMARDIFCGGFAYCFTCIKTERGQFLQYDINLNAGAHADIVNTLIYINQIVGLTYNPQDLFQQFSYDKRLINYFKNHDNELCIESDEFRLPEDGDAMFSAIILDAATEANKKIENKEKLFIKKYSVSELNNYRDLLLFDYEIEQIEQRRQEYQAEIKWNEQKRSCLKWSFFAVAGITCAAGVASILMPFNKNN